MAEFEIPVCSSPLESSGESTSSHSSPAGSQESGCKGKAAAKSTRRCSSRGRKRLQGECHRPSSFPDEEEDKKRKRAKKERTRVSNLAVAYQTLARTLGLYPLRGTQKRITHEQILHGANKLINQLKKEVGYFRRDSPDKVREAIANESDNSPAYIPSKHYTISSSGQVMVAEEAQSISGQLDCLNHLDLSCDETLPLPTLEESDESSDVSMNVRPTSQTSSYPLLNFELLSPSSTHSSQDINLHQLLGASLTGESLVSSSSMGSISNLRHGLLLGSPTLMSLCAHIPTTSCQSYMSPPIDVVAYEEIVNDEVSASKSMSFINSPMAT